jgi:hypothetical protein
MHYSDLVSHTSALPEGLRQVLYDLPEGKVEILNAGVRNRAFSPLPEYRLYLCVDGRQLVPRHSDFFTDYLLKVEARPDLHLPLTEACELVCNGSSPQTIMTSKRLPRWFSEVSDKTATFQKSMDETAGLPTELFLCGLQAIIRLYELNSYVPKAAEAFRTAFLGLEKGKPFVEVVSPLSPQIRPDKRYFSGLERKA